MRKVTLTANHVADPVFAAIEAHDVAANIRLPILLNWMDTQYDPTVGNALNEVTDVEIAASEALINIRPTTVAGVAALLAYVTKRADNPDHEWIGHMSDDLDPPPPFEARLIRSLSAAMAQIDGAETFLQ